MLTKNLLRYRTVGKAVKPSFIRTDDPKLLDLAESLTAAYQSGVGSTRGELEESTAPIVASAKELKLGRGIEKTLLDRCSFAPSHEYDYATLRKALFARSAELLSGGGPGGVQTFRDEVFKGCAEELLFLKDGIYADLPDNERLLSVKEMSPKELLERYNSALAQSLLLFCARMDARVSEPDPGRMRRLFKYLKFFRLLARIWSEDAGDCEEGVEASASQVRLEVDGPASIFEHTTKYGLQLACFLPALCQASAWSIDCEVKTGERMLRLKLDESSGLVSHYGNMGAYIPEEVAVFHKLFKARVPEWRIGGGTPFLRGEGQSLIFPDFTFERADGGAMLHLELFHRWHSGQLAERLGFCERHPDMPLLIGVDRSASSEGRLKALLEGSEWFSQRGFLFRDFPGVETVRRLLESVSQKTSPEPPLTP